ncbi:MAG: hypothetical protein GXP31_07230 [Kiritimatiellaeota bacterium]|nr:hypothetical protein [Kiritimatiellota bacterium]
MDLLQTDEKPPHIPARNARASLLLFGVLCGTLLGIVAAPAARRIASAIWERGQPDGPAVAEVEGRTISVADFCRAARRRGGVHPGLLDRKALLDELIQRQCLLIKAERDGVPHRPEALRSIANIVIGQLRGLELEPVLAGVGVSRDEVEAYYALHRERYRQGPKSRLAIVYVKTFAKMDVSEAARCRKRIEDTRALALSQRISPVNGFGPLTIRASEDQRTRYKGGVIGWVEAGRERYRYPTPVIRAGFALREVGDISDVIDTREGLYLVRLTDRRPATTVPLTAVEAKIRHKLLLLKRKATEQRFYADARGDIDVRTFPAVLESIAFPRGEPRTPRDEVPPGMP